MLHSYGVFLLLVSAAVMAFACGPNGSKDKPPNIFKGIALTDGYEGEAIGDIAGNSMKITYKIHSLQGDSHESPKETSSKSTGYKTGRKNYAVHPKIIKTDDFKDYHKN